MLIYLYFRIFENLINTKKKCRFWNLFRPLLHNGKWLRAKSQLSFFHTQKNITKSYKCACFYGIQWVKKGENITMFLDIFLHFMPKKMSKLQIIKVATRFSFLPLWDCFELRACLTGRCLCRQNINKYSNKPAQRVF